MNRIKALLTVLAAISGCGETTASATGSAKLALMLQHDISLDSVQYVITKGPNDYRRASVDINDSREIALQLGALPAADDYAMSVTATTMSGVSCTATSEPFEIEVDKVTGLSLKLDCSDEQASRGNARVDVAVSKSECPEVDGVTVLPSSVIVGATMMLQGYSTIEGAEFEWSAAEARAGTFSDATSAQTSFTCGSEGHYTLTLALSKDGCPTDIEQVDVDCTSPCELAACQPGTSCSYQLSEGLSCTLSCADSNIASVSVTYADNCTPVDCTAAASECVGTDTCNVSVDNSICGSDPCPGTPKSGSVMLTCSPSGSGSDCEAAPCPPGTSCSYQFTEEQSCMVSCADGSIAAVSVTYADNCMPLDCPAAAAECAGEEACTISVGNSICGSDPCPGIHKSSNVELTCSPGGSGNNCEAAPCQPGTSCSYQFAEEQSCMVSCADSSIASVSVTYADNCMPLDCPAAAAECADEEACTISVGNSICGSDPCPGTHKSSSVVLTCSIGVAGSSCEAAPCQAGTSCSYQFAEEQSCMVSCADSSIASISVTYADNCMPVDCPAAAPECAGEEACNVSVSNSICGMDPCPGTRKVSNVMLNCNAAGSGSP